MSLLTYQGKLLNKDGHLVAKFTQVLPESTIFIAYGSNVPSIVKSIDSGLNFSKEASTNTPGGYGATIMKNDSSGNLYLGIGNGWIYRYNTTTKVFDSSINSGLSSMYDMQIRDNIRIVGDLNGNIATF